MSLVKWLMARLPGRWQTELKRVHFGRQIRRGTFATGEPDYRLLDQLVASGDWVVDIGANVGHYTQRLSDLVGRNGRVIAFEPVPTTFSILAANVQLFPYSNVSLINAAASDRLSVVGMAVPSFSSGLRNYYEAHISAAAADGELRVLTVPLDSLAIDARVTLVKIDVEGHESPVLAGMQRLIERHRPVLIVETGSGEVISRLTSLGYTSQRLPGSPNVIFRPRA